MRDEDYAKLLEDTQHELLAGLGPAGVLGLTPVTLRLLASLVPSGLDRAMEAIYAPQADGATLPLTVPVRPLRALSEAQSAGAGGRGRRGEGRPAVRRAAVHRRYARR